jgi:hypothetical protein
MTASLNTVFRLAFAQQHHPYLLDDLKGFRKMTGLCAADDAETLSMVRGIVEGLLNWPPQRGIPFTDPLQKAG